jgi:adenylate cyclase
MANGGPKPRRFRIGFRPSIIAVFVGVVLAVGLSLVWLSFERVTRITYNAASGFIGKVAQLGADHVDEQFTNVRDNLQILAGLPSIRAAEIVENPRLYALLASMLRNNQQLFNLYVGYDDGSFLEMDIIDRAPPTFRTNLKIAEEAFYRLVVMQRSGRLSSATIFLSEKLGTVESRAEQIDYDPRQRAWYLEALKSDKTLLTGPYVFFATGEPGYTLRIALEGPHPGVVAGDLLLNTFENMLAQQKLGKSGVAFLFDDANRIVGHPEMRKLIGGGQDLPTLAALDVPGLTPAIDAWRSGGGAQQVFTDKRGRTYLTGFHRVQSTGKANVRLAEVAPLDEFYGQILSERRALFALALALVGATLPLAFWLGSMIARPLRKLADETDEIQRFEIGERPRIRSSIVEIDELGRSVFTMRSVVRSFASFVPKQIVRQLVETESVVELGGVRREITVLFTDVADFTSKTEKADPSRVMIHTSRYFAALSDEIMRHRGTIDKFIGDAVMAFWNAPLDESDHTESACKAVLACIRANAELNGIFQTENWPPYETRFGLHVGEAVVGNIGSNDRMNYTALGATVNLASRLEGLNKNYGTRVLTSLAVRHRVNDKFLFRTVDSINPKGFGEPVEINELRGELSSAYPSEVELCRRWEEVYRSIASDHTELASSNLSRFLLDYPDDPVAVCHAQRLKDKLSQQAA